MKAYQVFKGELDKHDNQYYELMGTYLNQDKAMAHCNQIVADDMDGNDAEKYESEGYVSWSVRGWNIVTICKMEAIDIIE
jgi:hypothetical protein